VAKRDCMNVKVEADLVRKAKVVAAARHITLTDYVSDLLRAAVQSDLARVAAGLTETSLAAEENGSPAQPGPEPVTLIKR
jgi:hypothetical protein